MRTRIGLTLACGLLIALPFAIAQRPGGGPPGGGPPGPPDGGHEVALSKQEDVNDLVTRMMAFDADKDGSLTRPEITDARLTRLFDRADADKSGTVTKAELTALAEKEHADVRGFGGPGGGPPGFGGPGGPPGFGPGGPPRPGEILPAMLQQRLRITPAQKAQIDALQKDVDAKLETILDEEQRSQLKEMRSRGPRPPR